MSDAQTLDQTEIVVGELLGPIQTSSSDQLTKYDDICHYTSIGAFNEIIKNKQIWLSNVAAMNDYNEIRGGAQQVYNLYIENSEVLIPSRPDLREDIRKSFSDLFDRIHLDTYAFCFSGHNRSDDVLGRLGMWRAYGGDGDGVCVVMNKELLFKQTSLTNFPIYWTAMIYESQDSFKQRVLNFFNSLDSLLEKHKEIIAVLPNQNVIWYITFSLIVLSLSHKHISFAEENEFRYIHLASIMPPTIFPEITYHAAAIGTKLRPVLRVPIKTYGTGETVGGAPAEIFKSVIVGPSEDRLLQQRAAQIALGAAGLVNVPVRYSEIPYRKGR